MSVKHVTFASVESTQVYIYQVGYVELEEQLIPPDKIKPKRKKNQKTTLTIDFDTQHSILALAAEMVEN